MDLLSPLLMSYASIPSSSSGVTSSSLSSHNPEMMTMMMKRDDVIPSYHHQKRVYHQSLSQHQQQLYQQQLHESSDSLVVETSSSTSYEDDQLQTYQDQDQPTTQQPPPLPPPPAQNNQEPEVPLEKPPFTYVALITMAIKASPMQELPLNKIYEFVRTHFPYYKMENKGWQNSIRHNLSLNQCFLRKEISPGHSGERKRGVWYINPLYENMFENGNYLKRKKISKRHIRDIEYHQSRVGQTRVGQRREVHGRQVVPPLRKGAFRPCPQNCGCQYMPTSTSASGQEQDPFLSRQLRDPSASQFRGHPFQDGVFPDNSMAQFYNHLQQIQWASAPAASTSVPPVDIFPPGHIDGTYGNFA